MKLDEVWSAYCGDRLGPRTPYAKPVPISPWLGMKLLYPWLEMLQPRAHAVFAVSYDTAFDKEADGALCKLAIEDSFASWDGMSAGAWRVVYERAAYAMAVMGANEVAGNPVISHLPEGLSEQEMSRALGLRYLLGGARTIDRRLLKTTPAGTIPDFPPSTVVRRQ